LHSYGHRGGLQDYSLTTYQAINQYITFKSPNYSKFFMG
jgi:hypothetical protein